MSTASEKGRILEDSVELIERTILGATNNATGFTIDPRRRLEANGVTHEIDLYVTLRNAPGYESVVIFECKNWKAKVGKNEIIVFSRKIAVSGAQRGFFVAKDFTSDAEAEAAQDNRMELLRVDIDSGEKLAAPLDFHLIVVKHSKFALTVVGDVALPDGEIDQRPITIDGTTTALAEYAAAWRTEIESQATSNFPSHALPNGIYPFTISDTRRFDKAMMADTVIHSATLDITFDIHIEFPRVSVDVKNRGITYVLSTEAAGGHLQMMIASIPNTRRV